ncbi:major capsid protein [Luteimonas saliphila]|nr:major capsid protein [Luteimonas saliphila]
MDASAVVAVINEALVAIGMVAVAVLVTLAYIKLFRWFGRSIQ